MDIGTMDVDWFVNPFARFNPLGYCLAVRSKNHPEIRTLHAWIFADMNLYAWPRIVVRNNALVSDTQPAPVDLYHILI